MNISNKIRGIREILQFDNRWYILLTRVLFPRQSAIIYKYKGLDILIDHAAGDVNGAREVLTSNMYRKYLPYFKEKNSLNVLDIGSNNGGFPLLLMSERLGLEKLVCVEFNPNTHSRLKFNLERNFKRGAVILNSALCGNEQNFNISLGQGGVSDNIYNSSNSLTNTTYLIEGITFDKIYENHFNKEVIDVCKIDIEGAEFEMVEANTCRKLSKCRFLLIEIHHSDQHSREIVLKKFQELGFSEIDGEDKKGETHYVHFFINQNI